MQHQYYKSDFKPLRNQLNKYSPLTIINYCIFELQKTWNGISGYKLPSLPWHIFNIMIWGVHFGDPNSRKIIDGKSFNRIYNLTKGLPDENIVIEKEIKDFELWWEIRKIFHQQRLYQIDGGLLGVGFILTFLDEIPDSKIRSLTIFLIFFYLAISQTDKPTSFNKEYFLPLIDKEDLDFIWEFYHLTQDKVIEIAENSIKEYKTVYFERNSFTAFRDFPVYVDRHNRITTFQLPILNYYLRNCYVDVLIKQGYIERKLIEDKFEEFIIDYAKSFDKNFNKTKTGADLILIKQNGNVFIEIKSGRLHGLLPQFPTIEAHLESLRSTIVKGYQQILYSYRKNMNSDCVGFIITFNDLTFGLPQDNWKLWGYRIFKNEDLTQDEQNFLENYVWVVDYVEFIESIHAINGFEDIHKFMNDIVENNKTPGNKKHSLLEYAKKPRSISEIHIIGSLLEKHFKKIKSIIEENLGIEAGSGEL